MGTSHSMRLAVVRVDGSWRSVAPFHTQRGEVLDRGVQLRLSTPVPSAEACHPV